MLNIPMLLYGLQAGTQMIGSVAEGIQGQNAASFNRRVAGIQGDVAEQNAEIEKELIGQKADAVRARQTVNAAHSNVDVTQGTPLLAMLDTLAKSEADKGMVRRRLGLTRWQLELERRVQKFAGQQAMLRGIGGAGGALMKGGLQVAGALKAGQTPGNLAMLDQPMNWDE